jgi:hypothetical protein
MTTEPTGPVFRLNEVIGLWLLGHGYDGIAGEECGCGIDNLMPCLSNHGSGPDLYKCVAGHKVDPCTCDRHFGTALDGPHVCYRPGSRKDGV